MGDEVIVSMQLDINELKNNQVHNTKVLEKVVASIEKIAETQHLFLKYMEDVPKLQDRVHDIEVNGTTQCKVANDKIKTTNKYLMGVVLVIVGTIIKTIM